jgi:hypothetical protein
MKRRWGKDTQTGADPKQLALEWSASNHTPPATVDPTPTRAVVTAEEPGIPGGSGIASARATGRAARRPVKGIVARLPVPRPLPASIAAGRFGHDEDGAPIRPGADEVLAITDNHADKLIDMLDALVAVPGRPATATSLPALFQSILTEYAQDFGDHAARQLEVYARRQSSLDDSLRTDRGWHR